LLANRNDVHFVAVILLFHSRTTKYRKREQPQKSLMTSKSYTHKTKSHKKLSSSRKQQRRARVLCRRAAARPQGEQQH
jgi:hypothetical protein